MKAPDHEQTLGGGAAHGLSSGLLSEPRTWRMRLQVAPTKPTSRSTRRKSGAVPALSSSQIPSSVRTQDREGVLDPDPGEAEILSLDALPVVSGERRGDPFEGELAYGRLHPAHPSSSCFRGKNRHRPLLVNCFTHCSSGVLRSVKPRLDTVQPGPTWGDAVPPDREGPFTRNAAVCCANRQCVSFAIKPVVAKPLLAAALVGASTWAGASPAGVAPSAETMQVAAAELPVPQSSTSTSPPTTTTTAAPTTHHGRTDDHGPAPRPPRRPAPPGVDDDHRPVHLPGAGRRPPRWCCGPVTPPPARDISVYRGLGTWIDAYDFSPQYQPNGTPPPVTPESMDDLAVAGVKTLYLQAAKDDVRSPGDLVNPEILGPDAQPGPRPGHQGRGLVPPEVLRPRLRHAPLPGHAGLPGRRRGFDGIGNDIEWTKDVPNHAERSVRLIELSRRLRAAMGSAALSAIPLPPVLIETINPKYWPGFPWRELAPLYDVWMPMAYWTFRTKSSGYRDAYRYTEENVRRTRINLGLPGRRGPSGGRHRQQVERRRLPRTSSGPASTRARSAGRSTTGGRLRWPVTASCGASPDSRYRPLPGVGAHGGSRSHRWRAPNHRRVMVMVVVAVVVAMAVPVLRLPVLLWSSFFLSSSFFLPSSFLPWSCPACWGV